MRVWPPRWLRRSTFLDHDDVLRTREIPPVALKMEDVYIPRIKQETGRGSKAMSAENLEVVVKGLTFDPVTNVPIIILKDVNGTKMLPIWIGVFEANAIALEMESISTPRPMTHDLLKNVFDIMNGRMVRIVVDNLEKNTFYATIYVDFMGEELRVDSRPSDAIALALRAKVPIFVSQTVMEEAQSFEIEDEGLGDKASWKEWLAKLKPEDFSRYQS